MLTTLSVEGFRKLLPDREVGNLFRVSPIIKNFTAFKETLGNFTIVVVKVDKGMFAGVSKRNPVDVDANGTGLRIAAVRAWRSMWGEDPGYLRQRPVSKRDAKLASNVSFAKLIEESRYKIIRGNLERRLF
jgi:hypothetical protein